MTDESSATSPEQVAAAICQTPTAATAPRRRRLWQLPTQAHELLLALSFTPEWLRKEAARTLGQVHKGRCVLKGRDVDVLYSVVHDLTTRNPMAEAFQKHLDQRHALAVQRLAKLHQPEALRAAWAEALDAEDLPAALWAVLTHPLGSELESAALYDARAWTFAHARRSVALGQAQHMAETRATQARHEAEELRGRLMAQQRQAAQTLAQAQADIARLTGEIARLHSKPIGLAQLTAWTPCTDTGTAALKTNPTGSVHAPEALKPLPVAPALPPVPMGRLTSTTTAPPRPASQAIVVQGRRVLCVGGIQHAVARYRGRIENLGGRFEHHDGGLEDSIHALEGRLNRADVVICQAACINHEAYHRVKRHCERTGKPCVYLDRPSLSRFDRAFTRPTFDPHHTEGRGATPWHSAGHASS